MKIGSLFKALMPKEFVSNSFKIFTVSFYAVNSYGDRSIVRSPANIIPGYINFSKALQTACLETLMEDKNTFEVDVLCLRRDKLKFRTGYW